MWLRISISLAASDLLETIALWRDAGIVPRGAPAKVSVGNADRSDAIERWPAQHALWLRGLECWAIIAGREVRLDDTYTAEPTEPPAWARAGI